MLKIERPRQVRSTVQDQMVNLALKKVGYGSWSWVSWKGWKKGWIQATRRRNEQES